MLARIARSSAQTIAVTFDGDTPTTVTIGIVNAAGDVVAAPGAATTESAGIFSFDLTPAMTADLGVLTATWTADDDQELVTELEVVGFHVISLAALRGFEPLDDEALYDEPTLRAGRDLATAALERACNRAFAPRKVTETLTGRGSAALPLRPGVSELASITADGETLDLDGILVDPTGFVEKASGVWTRGGSFVVTYVYGESSPDPRVARAVGLVAADVIFTDQPAGSGSGIPQRATSLSTEDGTFSLVTAGMGSSFSLPEVNAVVQEWRLPS